MRSRLFYTDPCGFGSTWLEVLAMELRDILDAAIPLATVAASLGVARHQVAKHDQHIELHGERLAALETEAALLKQEQGSHRRQIDDLVLELRAAVSNLQRVALDLASLTGKGKN